MRVYHGSPYRFTAFSPEHIGHGEGVQAYGHGHYVTASASLANWYRSNLSGPPRIDGAFIGASSLSSGAKTFLTAARGDLALALRNVEEAVRRRPENKLLPPIKGELCAIDPDRVKKAGAHGYLYEIELATDALDLLDWDKPLIEQSRKVRQAFASAISMGDPLAAELLGDLSEPEQLHMAGLFPKSLGAQAYKTLASERGEAAAAETLRQAGLAGITFMDDRFCGTVNSGRNFTVFPGCENLLAITHINDIPVNQLSSLDAVHTPLGEPCEPVDFAPMM